MDLINLQRIYLSRCRIVNIDDRTFKGLSNLVELDLSGNLLEVIPTETFVDCRSLMRLTLSSNPIRTLKRAAFDNLPFLNTLELRNCEISKIEPGTFSGLNSLEWLHLSKNKLTSIKASSIMLHTLKGVQLQDNPWECDCNAIDLHDWLISFNIPHNIQPVCSGPLKFQNRPVKSIPISELACLPDVAPTTLYLEIGEGKNVTLLCHVNAIPEARVTWWFQGQLLQNDSLIAPGMRLLYYIEEGHQEKRSELFIYNTSTEDNGTFVCTAENSAGISHANFTIRVIIRQEKRVEEAPLPFEIMLTILVVACVTAILLLIVIILSAIKCHRDAMKKGKRRNNKMSSLDNSTKDILFPECSEEYSETSKESCNVVEQDQIMFYSAHSCGELLKTMAPVAAANQTRNSPLSLHRYQLEQNPDLINDTGTVERRHNGDGEDGRMFVYAETMENLELSSHLPHNAIKTPTGLRKSTRDLYRLSADVHLNPVGLLNSGGSRAQYNGNCYRTLPYNRAGKRQSAANPANRCSREAEFLSQTGHPAPFEHYCQDVRYTADGYPVRNTYPVENVGLQNLDPLVQWPACLPVHLHHTNSNLEENIAKTVAKKSVGAQTQLESGTTINPVLNKSLSNLSKSVDGSSDISNNEHQKEH